MQRTPFYDYMAERGGKFVDFAGWEMPISFGSVIDEHNHTREHGGLFDVSHMGRLKITGRHARRFLERALTRRVSDMKPKTCRYSMVCNEQGGVKDDVIVYRFDDHWLLVVNASNRAKIVEHLHAVTPSSDAVPDGKFIVNIEDQTESTGMVAVQGPGVMEMIGKFSKEVPTLKRYAFCTKNLLIVKMIISRTGYTGEDGVEVILNASMANMAIKLLLKDQGDTAASIKPCGLGARDTLRIEAGMPLYGHELDETIDPISAGLEFAVSLDKDTDENGETFIGQDALKKIVQAGPVHRLIGLSLEGKRTPRQGMEVSLADNVIGRVTSGCLSPTLGHPIAMAYVDADKAAEGGAVSIALGSGEVEAKIVALPFYKRSDR